MKAVPLTFKQAKEFIAQNHRHHKPPVGWKFGIGAEIDGELRGVVVASRPVSRMLDSGKILEVTRLCTDGSKNMCSFLYNRAKRVAFEMGYEKVITYILESESGISLKASGWRYERKAGGGSWSTPSRVRIDKAPLEAKQLWSIERTTDYPTGERRSDV